MPSDRNAIAAPPLAQPGRRRALKGLAGYASLCAGCLALSGRAGAHGAAAHRIDTHHHIFPPAYLAAARDGVVDSSPGAPTDMFDKWSPRKSLDDMDKQGVATAIVSISTPGVFFGDVAQGRRLARECNEYGAKMIADHPGRFGMFAAVPLPDVEGSLREIAYALDELKLNGVGLLTSYGDRWAGDPAFFPVFEELNRRKATVYFHPTAANCCGNLVPETKVSLEYPTDTARCAASLYINGVLSRCPDIRFILSHGGGSLPSFASRIDALFAGSPTAPRWPTRAMDEFRRLHYDTAAILNPPAMAALRQLVPASQILMGSDFPYRSAGRAVKEIRDLGMFTETELEAVERGNALRIVPGLATAGQRAG